jgi:5-formaminoimidazole-4-carboxamide-1-(beta)-D-ribofuranosyl 5'-monophosphate synthetase
MKAKKIKDILEKYNSRDISIGTLGGHSALDICRGAKLHGFRTVVVCQKGREKTYQKYYKRRDNGDGIVDEVILVDKFKDVTGKAVQEKLRGLNTIFVHNRYFWVYCNFKQIESSFNVPIFGSRSMLKLEERDVPKNQYYILEKAGIKIPKIIKKHQEIDRPVIVKVSEAKRGFERAFFFAENYGAYTRKSSQLLKKKTITQQALRKAVIEEYAIGAHVNLNYFYSSLNDELELMGTDTRRQTNLDGLLRMPVTDQIAALRTVRPKLIETGHIAVTVKESLLERIFDIGERFVAATKKLSKPGIIGPFALQASVVTEEGKEDIVVFDVSMRIPGSPGTMFTPYSSYLHHKPISYGERIAMEIRQALDQNKLDLVCT